MTTKGKINHGTGSQTQVDADGKGGNAETGPQTPKETGLWSSVAHGVLGVASFVPGVSLVAGPLDALLYTSEGNLVEAGFALASVVPGAKIATTAARVANSAAKATKAATATKAAKAAQEAAEAAKAAKLAKEAKAAQEAAEAAKAAKLAKDAGQKRAKGTPPPKGKKDTTVKAKKPHKNCGKKVNYNDKETLKKSGLEKDHTPSGGALKKAVALRVKKMKETIPGFEPDDKQIKAMQNAARNNAPTIGIPKDVHKRGNTHGSKNTEDQIKRDAGNLKDAAKRDTEKIFEEMDDKDGGCKDAYDKAAKEIREFDWDKHVQDSIDKVMKKKP